MKTEFEFDKKVKSYLEDAEKLSEEIRGIRLITSDCLLATILDNYCHLTQDIEDYYGYGSAVFIEDLQSSSIITSELLENCYIKNNKEEKYSKELIKILEYAQDLARKKGKEEIEEEALIVALVQNPNPIWKVMSEIDAYDLSIIKRHFSEEKYLDTTIKEVEKEVIEEKEETLEKQESKFFLNNMLELLNVNFNKEDKNIILGRDKEIEKIFTIFQKMTTKNVILTGKAGVGKTAIVDGITERIVKGQCPKEFLNKKVMSLDINGLMENTRYIGQVEEKFKMLKTYLEQNEDVILFIDEIHNIIGLGKIEDGSYDFANALKPILTNGKVRVIGATTKKEYDKYIKKDGALARRFELIDVEEPKTKDLYKMLRGKTHQLEEYHNVKVKADIFETVVSEASGYNFNVANPARTVDLLDTSMVIAKNHNKEEVDIQSVLEVHKENIEKFRKMDMEVLREVAYHEAGHFVLYKALNYKAKTVTLVSIIPAEDYLGVNVFEEEKEYLLTSKEYYINEIAECLAGEIAVTLKGYPKNSGKSSDIEYATERARMMVLQYGMEEGSKTLLGKLNSFSKEGKIELEYLSDSQKEELSKQTNEILKKAYTIAEEVLKKEEKRLDVIAEALIERGSLTKREADGLYSGKYQIKDLTKSNIELIK